MTCANTRIECRGLEPSAEGIWRREAAAGLAALGRLAPVRQALVRLERQAARPPYQALAWLTSGAREIRAAARDHTWVAAWRKALARLRNQLEPKRRPRRSRGPARRTPAPS